MMTMKNVMMTVCVLVLVGCGTDQGNPQYDQGYPTDLTTGDLGGDTDADSDSGEIDLSTTVVDLGILDDLGIVDVDLGEMDLGIADGAGLDLAVVEVDAGTVVDLGVDLGPSDLGTDAGPPDLGITFCVTVADCNDHNPCTVDTCVPYLADFTCSHTPYDGDADGYPPIVCGGTDCDDANSAINPDVTELCNGIDDNCNGSTDEGTRGTACTVGVGACAGLGTLACGGGPASCDAVAGTSSIEVFNSIDDDCDGLTDECVSVVEAAPEFSCEGTFISYGGTTVCRGIDGGRCWCTDPSRTWPCQ